MPTTTTDTTSTTNVVPYCRSNQITFVAKNLLFSTELNAWFDGKMVTSLIRKPNIIEVTGTSGNFKAGDVIGYKPTSSSFVKTGKIIDVYKKNSGTVVDMRLYVIDDFNTPSSYTGTSGATIYNAFYDSYGSYLNSTDSGVVSSTTHYSGIVAGVTSSTSITLDAKASSVDGFYNGQSFNVVTKNSTVPNAVTSTQSLQIDSAKIIAYNGTTKLLTLDQQVSTAIGSTIYSIGKPKSNEGGTCSGVFYLPEGIFPTGQRIFRLDNRIVSVDTTTFQLVSVPGSETTYAEAIYSASGTYSKATSSQYSSGTGVSNQVGTGTTNASVPVTASGTTTGTSVPVINVLLGQINGLFSNIPL